VVIIWLTQLTLHNELRQLGVAYVAKTTSFILRLMLRLLDVRFGT